MVVPRVVVCGLAVLAGCANDRGQYSWDDRTVLCSFSVDDLIGGLTWDRLEEQLDIARDHGSVAMFHAHEPGNTITIDRLERLLDAATARHLDLIPFSELGPSGPGRGAVSLSFDDDQVDTWYSIRDLLAAHAARVTFFITFYDRMSEDRRTKLAELAAAGHGVEAHSVNHLHAPEYATEHGVDAYIADEVLPSIEILEADGYPVTSYTFPYGASTRALEAAVLQHVQRVRVGMGTCPH